MEFNNKLYELRKQKGLSQEELAHRLNVSRQTISKWEVGESTPDMENLVAISELFGISLDELVLDKKTALDTEAPAKADLYTDIKKHVLNEDNKQKVKKGIRIAGVILGILLLVDLISFAIYAITVGLPK